MYNNSVRSDKPFLSIGTPRGVALTSLDKYLSSPQNNDENATQNATSQIQNNEDPSETILSLQREQDRLTEELNTERRRSESLKATFSKSLAQTAAEQREKLLVLKQILEAEPDNAYIKEALKYIGDIEQDNSNQPTDIETPRINELAKRAKEVELNVENQRKQNQKLKETYKEQKEEINKLKQDLDDLNSQIEAINNSMQELREKSKSIKESALKKKTAWKERIAQLEAQVLEQ